eukprot:136173-Amphidinium_carterae.1
MQRRIEGALKVFKIWCCPAVQLMVDDFKWVSSRIKLSSMESCRTDADYVRKELEATTWHVVHPYCDVEYPGIVDAKVSLSAVRISAPSISISA